MNTLKECTLCEKHTITALLELANENTQNILRVRLCPVCVKDLHDICVDAGTDLANEIIKRGIKHMPAITEEMTRELSDADLAELNKFTSLLNNTVHEINERSKPKKEKH